MTVSQPWLIQRALIQTPFADVKDATLSNSVRFDYMGAAEFEYGALPKSLRRLRESAKDKSIKVRTVKEILSKESSLRVLSRFSDSEFQEYLQHLHLLRQGQIRLKESSYFDITRRHHFPTLYDNTDFWWDIDNDVMWSFNKVYMKKLPSYLENSFKVMK